MIRFGWILLFVSVFAEAAPMQCLTKPPVKARFSGMAVAAIVESYLGIPGKQVLDLAARTELPPEEVMALIRDGDDTGILCMQFEEDGPWLTDITHWPALMKKDQLKKLIQKARAQGLEQVKVDVLAFESKGLGGKTLRAFTDFVLKNFEEGSLMCDWRDVDLREHVSLRKTLRKASRCGLLDSYINSEQLKKSILEGRFLEEVRNGCISLSRLPESNYCWGV